LDGQADEAHIVTNFSLDKLHDFFKAAVVELDQWDGAAPLGCAPEFASACRVLLLHGAVAATLDEIDAHLAAVERLIVESGPLTSAFLPSFDKARAALPRKR
jgi:hypothetical protein